MQSLCPEVRGHTFRAGRGSSLLARVLITTCFSAPLSVTTSSVSRVPRSPSRSKEPTQRSSVPAESAALWPGPTCPGPSCRARSPPSCRRASRRWRRRTRTNNSRHHHCYLVSLLSFLMINNSLTCTLCIIISSLSL